MYIRQEYQKSHEGFYMSYPVKDYMRKDIATIDVEASAAEASKIMMEKNVGYAVVLEKSQPAGIITERDLVQKVMAKEKDPSMVEVGELMSTPLISIDPDATIEEAVRTMAENGIRKLPVVRSHIIYGIFTTRELAKNFNKYEERVTGDIIRRCYSPPF
jgi:CBS domain-containing protein